MTLDDELVKRIESKRSLIRDYADKIVALAKQGHIDALYASQLERELDSIYMSMSDLHVKTYRNANNNLLKKWDLDA